jgi:hypothetical protein
MIKIYEMGRLVLGRRLKNDMDHRMKRDEERKNERIRRDRRKKGSLGIIIIYNNNFQMKDQR